MRAYTVNEIEALRRACRNRVIWGRYGGAKVVAGGAAVSMPHYEDEVNREAEDMVRTYILAGRTAEDLITADGE